METTLEVFAEKISNALNTDNAELHLRMQTAEHEHELKMFSVFTQFLERSNHSQHPPFYQAPVQPPHYNPRQPQPQRSFHSFTQPPPLHMASPQSPPFSETTNQPLSFLQIWLNLYHSAMLPPTLQSWLSPSARPQHIHHSTNLQRMRKTKSIIV